MAMWLFRGLMLAALVAFLWALSIKHGWLPPRSDEAREALDRIDAPRTPASAERNAFAAVWFIAYDLPAERLPELMAADVARAQAVQARGESLTEFAPGVPEGAVADPLFASRASNEDTHDSTRSDGEPVDPDRDTHDPPNLASPHATTGQATTGYLGDPEAANQDTHDSPPPATSPGEQFEDTHHPPDPPSPNFQDTHQLCGRTPHCLDTLVRHRPALRALLTQHAPLLARYRALSRFDELRSPLPASVAVDLAAYDFGWRLDTTAIALDYLDGHVAEALAALCHQAGAVRNLRARTDVLLASTLGASQLAIAAQLYADMRARAPADLPLPDECTAAFAPLTEDEFAQCDAMKREFTALDSLLDTLRTGADANAPMPAWLLNRAHARARLAMSFARWCSPEHAREVFERRPMPAAPPPACTALEVTFDAYGCWLGQHAVPDFSSHYHRLLDVDAILRAVNVAQWLNARDPKARRADFLARPMAWRTEHHDITLAADGGSLHVPLLAASGVFPDGVIVALRPIEAVP